MHLISQGFLWRCGVFPASMRAVLHEADSTEVSNDFMFVGIKLSNTKFQSVIGIKMILVT